MNFVKSKREKLINQEKNTLIPGGKMIQNTKPAETGQGDKDIILY